MNLEIVTITPAMAEQFLSKNTTNRNLNVDRVLFYSIIIGNGNWLLNGESIKIDKAGNLLDGQHRLSAIIKAGKAIKTVLATNVDASTFTTIDTGKPRNAADCLKIEGVANSTNISGGISKYLAFKNGHKSGSNRVVVKTSNSDILQEYNSNPLVYQSIYQNGVAFYNHVYRIITPADYIAFYRYFQLKYHTNVIDSFFENITNKIGVCGLLHDKLMMEKVTKRKLITSEKNAIMIKAFIYHATGKNVKVLKYQIDEPFPSILKLK